MKKNIIFIFIVIQYFAFANIILSESIPDSTRLKLERLSDVEKVKYLSDLGWKLREKNTELAFVYGQYAVKLADSLNIKQSASRANNLLGVIYIHYNYNTELAIPYFKKGLEYALQTNDSLEISYSYINLGDVFLLTGNAPLASEYSETSLNYFKKMKDRRGIAYSYNNIGLVNRFNKKYNTALDYFQKAIKIREELGDKTGVASALLEVARTYFAQNEFNIALDYYQKSYKLHKEINNNRYMAYCLNGIGNIYYHLGKYNDALIKYDESIKLNLQRSNDFGVVNSRLGKALVYSKMKEKLKGEIELKLALEIANKLNLAPNILKAYETFTKFYMNLHDFITATEKFNEFLYVYDSLLSKQQFETLSEIESRFEIAQKLKETNLELNVSKNQEVYLVVIILLMIIIFSVLVWRYQANKSMNQKLKLLNESKDKLFSIISHDLKNPFMSLMGNIDMLKKEVLPEDKKSEIINDLGIITQNTYNLLENLLNLSASRTGILKYSPTSFSINLLMESIINSLSIEIKKKSINITNNLEQSVIYADSQMIEITIRNLLINAIKFCNNNGKIIISSKYMNDFYSLSIADDGIGIEKEIQEKLFTSDIVISKRGTANEKGTGLGLSLCNEFIKKHNGKINIKSEFGKGSEFTIMLPSTSN